MSGIYLYPRETLASSIWASLRPGWSLVCGAEENTFVVRFYLVFSLSLSLLLPLPLPSSLSPSPLSLLPYLCSESLQRERLYSQTASMINKPVSWEVSLNQQAITSLQATCMYMYTCTYTTTIKSIHILLPVVTV